MNQADDGAPNHVGCEVYFIEKKTLHRKTIQPIFLRFIIVDIIITHIELRTLLIFHNFPLFFRFTVCHLFFLQITQSII
jgi:hypothetical protein